MVSRYRAIRGHLSYSDEFQLLSRMLLEDISKVEKLTQFCLKTYLAIFEAILGDRFLSSAGAGKELHSLSLSLSLSLYEGAEPQPSTG